LSLLQMTSLTFESGSASKRFGNLSLERWLSFALCGRSF
jgi:hypothetical protein